MRIKNSTLMKLLDIPELWNSLIINKRKPETYRLFTFVGDSRICLHRFSPADETEAFWHPHPWPARFYLMDGEYKLFLSTSKDRESGYDPAYSVVTMRPGAYYDMDHPLSWHKIVPTYITYTIMINGPAWNDDVAHTAVRRTKGKDLECMSHVEVLSQLNKFKELVNRSVHYVF